VAFLQVLPTLSPRQYRAMQPAQLERRTADGHGPRSATRGATAVLQYGCIRCHRVPGIVGPDAPVGPPLEGFARRSFIAGRLPNTPANLVQWIRDPQAVKPGTAMPDLGVSERDAADIEAFLHRLR
jgi:cytochrome c1